MRDMFILGILFLSTILGFFHPFIMGGLFVWIDVFQPQTISYSFLSGMPLSLIYSIMVFSVYLLHGIKELPRVTIIHTLILLFAIWIGLTLNWAELPDDAWFKFNAAWKMFLFALFMPFIFRERDHLEYLVLVIIAAVGGNAISGGLKTVFSGGGGYGELQLLRGGNTGLFESSTASLVMAGLIPLILWAYKHQTFLPRWKIVGWGILGFIPLNILTIIGTQARAGLISLGVMLATVIWFSKRRVLYAGLCAGALVLALPFAPQSWTERMETISNPQGDASAGARLGVWRWTWEYVKEKPWGGGMGMWRLSNFEIDVVLKEGDPDPSAPGQVVKADRVVKRQEVGRGFHSVYFEILGETGFPGIILFLWIMSASILRGFKIYRYFRDKEGMLWASDLAKAMSIALMSILLGAAFVAIAYQSIIWFFVCIIICLNQRYLKAREEERMMQARAERLSDPRLTSIKAA